MSQEQVREPQANQALPTVQSIKGQMQLAMVQYNYQRILDEVNSLEYTEENLPLIKDTLERLNKVKKVIEEKHREGKEQYLRVCQMYDTAKKEQLAMVDNAMTTPLSKYRKMCQDIENRRKAQEEEIRKENELKAGIEKNVSHFATQIGAATTTEQLVAIEKAIGTEKSRKDKYGKFWDQAQERYASLAVIIKNQKSKIKEAEALRKKIEADSKKEDAPVEQIEANRERLMEIEEGIQDNVIKAQEEAIDYATAAPTGVPVAIEAFPAVKAKRSLWKWEVENIKETAKKMPDWVSLVPNEDKIDDYLKAKKQEGIEGEEFIFAGVKFYLEKTY